MTLPAPTARPIFVTGASSPLGLRVLRRLGDEGLQLCCLLHSGKHEREILNVEGVAVIRGDCRQAEPWEAALRGCGLLLHLAPIGLIEEPVRAALRQGVPRCVAISSTRGFSKLEDPVAVGVRRGEAALEASGLAYTILRCAMMYGSRRDANIQRLADWVDRHAWMPLLGGGTARIQPVHLDDVADAVRLAVLHPESLDRVALTLAGPRAVSWREMAETLARIRGRRLRALSIPLPAALFAARLLAGVSPRHRDLSGAVQRLAEERAYDLADTYARLPGWNPMELAEGLERTYALGVNPPGDLPC